MTGNLPYVRAIMPSPFPGMDPYLEVSPYWAPLHSAFIIAMQAELKKRVPRGYAVWSDVYIWLHEPDAETRGKPRQPDVFLTEDPSRGTTNGRTAVLTAPHTSILPAERRTGNKYLKIKEISSDRVITVIEVLSPANKTPGDDREAYLAKRNEYLATGANLVEIDLLRSRPRMPMGDPVPPDSDYLIAVCRAAEFPKIDLWPFHVRDKLPTIPVPLKAADGDVELPLGPCFQFAYDVGPFDQVVDYAKPPRVPLRSEDQAWAKERTAQPR